VATPGKAHAQDPEANSARDLYEQGVRAYEVGDFETAVAAFERAYTLSRRAALLFNVAQAERLAGPTHCERALAAYQRYASEEPNASNAAEVEQRIVEMKACSDAQRSAAPRAQPGQADLPRSAAAEPAKPALPPPAPPLQSRVGPFVTLGAGAVVAASGAVVYAVARHKFDQVAPTCPCREGQFAGWERASHISYGLLALGGAAIAVGAGWWLLDTKQQRATGYAVSVSAGAVSVSGRF
jgi:hypothetical protein